VNRTHLIGYLIYLQNCQVGSAQLPCCFTNDPVEARRAAVTGAITVQSRSFYSSFESLFCASLTHRDETENEKLNQIVQNEKQLFQNLRSLQWMESPTSLLYRPLMNAIQSILHAKVKSVIQGDFETPNTYQRVIQWKDETVQPWVLDVLCISQQSQSSPLWTSRNKDVWCERLTRCAAESYCWVRMEEIFDMVTSFPESYSAVIELRDVLGMTNMQNELGDSLKDSLIRRLNHSGADTSQIIDVYISTIKVLRIIDTSDRLLSVVAEPVRAYLRGRTDTVRCIITSLTDAEAGGDLYEELRRADAKPLENVTVDSDDEEEPPDLSWRPPPSLLKPRGTFLQTGSRNGESDILAMLVSIYGSKELFVNEYRLMLADKLLANMDYNTDKDRHTLELLKLRFGEVSMNSAEVMIKDIDDSVRSNKNIRDRLATNPPLRPQRKMLAGPIVDAVQLSHIFWPTLQNEQLKHHPRIQAELEEFSDAYAELKNPRKLKWMLQLGTVQLELETVETDLAGKPHLETKEFTCSPLLATLISHFEDRPTWTAEGLSNETGIAEHIIQKRMAFWISNRVVTFVGDKEYSLSSLEQRQLGGDQMMALMDDDHGAGLAVSVSAQEEEEMEVYESYVKVMLTSLHQAPLEKIHNMLKMMVSGSETKYNKTPQQLNAFLQHLCRQEKLECGPDGLYKLLKK
jgi:anaphase-promoting complex subunit 2